MLQKVVFADRIMLFGGHQNEHCNSIQFNLIQFSSIQCSFVDKIFSVVNLQCILVICCCTNEGI